MIRSILVDMKTITVLAKELSVSRQYVHKLIKQGKLPAVLANGVWMIADDALDVMRGAAITRREAVLSALDERKWERGPRHYSRVRVARAAHSCHSCGRQVAIGERYLSWAQSTRWKRAICWPCAILAPLRWPCRALEMLGHVSEC